MNWDELEPELRAAINTHFTTCQAQAFVLNVYGLNHAQTARAMHCHPGTAKIYLEQAQKKLTDLGLELPSP